MGKMNVRLVRPCHCLVRQFISLSDQSAGRLGVDTNPWRYPQRHRSLPPEAVAMLSVPTRWVWINLWKLWIVFDGPVGCRAARARAPARRSFPRAGTALVWSGDPGVLPVRHALERARSTARVVSPLPRGPDGAHAGWPPRRPAMECARRTDPGSPRDAAAVAAH